MSEVKHYSNSQKESTENLLIAASEHKIINVSKWGYKINETKEG